MKNNMSKKKTIKKPEEITLTKYTEFRFVHLENAQNLSQAVELGGYYAKLSRENSTYTVEIFSSR